MKGQNVEIEEYGRGFGIGPAVNIEDYDMKKALTAGEFGKYDGGAKIISLEEKRQETMPHLSGEAICLACENRWIAIAPDGCFELECPKCGCLKGVWGAWCLTETTWECNCGCDLFRASPNGVYCANCGVYQEFE